MDELFSKLEKVEKALKEQKEALEKKYVGFKKLKSKLASKPGITSPGGLAAAIGRKKYGKEKFQSAASKDKTLKEKQKKKSLKKSELVKSLNDAGFRQSALLLKNWDKYDVIAKEFIKSLDE